MSRKPSVQRTPAEKWQIVLEALKSGTVAETCRKYEIAPNLYSRWKDEVEGGAKAALGGGAQPLGLMPSRRNGSSNWSGRWAGRTCRLRS
jgi:transposase-like protein